MSKQEFEIQSESVEATEKLAQSIGSKLRGGETIELIGDVGAGKTTFVRGLARGIGSTDRVSSPTFTVSKVYSSKNIALHHYDFYRLDDLTIIQNELSEVLGDPLSSVVLEWANEVQDVLSPEHIRITIEVKSETARLLNLSIPEKYSYLRAGQ